MNLRDLKYLVAIYEHRHFSRAAEACFVSQPALSIQIKKLEKYLGVQLVERMNKKVMLTEIGETLARQAEEVLRSAEELKEMAKRAKDPYSGELKLGIIPTSAAYLLPEIMPKISQWFPKITVYLVEEKTEVLLEKLIQGKIDAALVALPIHNPLLTSVKLFSEVFMLAVPKSHPLAKQKMIGQKDLMSETLLLLEEGHCLRDQALAVCKKMKATERGDFSATSLETLRQMVISGVGITLMPKLACIPMAGIQYIPFVEPVPNRNMGLVWRTSAVAKTPLLKELAAKLSDISFAGK